MWKGIVLILLCGAQLLCGSSVGAAGAQQAAGEEELPMCKEDEVIKCYELVIRSYMEATMGAERAAGPLDLLSSQTVMSALTLTLDDTPRKLNTSCSVIRKVDMKGFEKCFETMAKSCHTDASPDQEIYYQALPSIRNQEMAWVVSVFSHMCNKDECDFRELTKAHKTMLDCYKSALQVVETAHTGNLTYGNCSTFEQYVTCQVQHASVCDFMRRTNQKYLRQHRGVIEACGIVLPPEAYADPLVAMTNTASNIGFSVQILVYVTVALVGASSRSPAVMRRGYYWK